MAFRGLLARSSAALAPLFAIRSYASAGTPPLCLYRASSLIRLRPLVSAAGCVPFVPVLGGGTARCFSTRPTTSSLNDPSPNWSNRPPKETILLDGCDFEHWLVVMEPPEGEPTRDEIIDSYIKTLAQVVGSEDEARMKIYSVSTRHYFAFGALVSEELSYKIKALPRVRWVLPDSYLDVKNKDYGGEPFIDGKAVPYDPKYHEEWVRNNARANERSRRNDRPRNFDRSRNFERRRENMQNFQNRAASPMPNQQFQSNVGPNPSPHRDMPPRDMPPLGVPAPGVVPPVPPPGNMPPPSPGGVPPPPSGGMPPPIMPYSSQGPGAVPTPPTHGTPSNYPNQVPPYRGNYNSPGTNTGFQGPPVPPGGGAPYQSGGGGYGYPSGGSGPRGGGAPYQSGGGYPSGGSGHQGGGTPYQSGGGGYPSSGSGIQGGGPGGTLYQNGGGGYSGGSSGHQGGGVPYQTGGGGGGHPGGGNAYQGGGGSFQPGSNPYQGQGRDIPGRD